PPGGAPHSRGLRGVPPARYSLGAPAPVPDVWPRRLLRFVARPPRAPACASDRPPDRPVLRARGGLALVLLRRDLRLSVDDGTSAAAVADAAEHGAQGSSLQGAPPPARRATGLASRAADLSQ